MFYRYDPDGRLSLVFQCDIADGAKHYYYPVTNSRGDIMEIHNGPGEITAKYNYDAWGKLLSVTDANGNVLPKTHFAYKISVRYRGYEYDSETGLYYLQSRYYDPETGRFINADDAEYIGSTKDNISFNAFTYCENDPVNDSDPSGHIAIKQIFALISEAINGVKEFCKLMLENYKPSKKAYNNILKTIKRNKGTKLDKIYAYVYKNQKSIKLLRNNAKEIVFLLDIISAIDDFAGILNGSTSRKTFILGVLFLGCVKLIKFITTNLLPKLLALIFKTLVILRYAVKRILEYIFSLYESSKYADKMKDYFVSYLSNKRVSFQNIFVAFFYSAKYCI